MADGLRMFAGWTKRDQIAFWVSIAFGVSVTETVGEAIRPSLDFWPAFAVKVAAGWVAVMVAFVVWARLIRPRLKGEKASGASGVESNPKGAEQATAADPPRE